MRCDIWLLWHSYNSANQETVAADLTKLEPGKYSMQFRHMEAVEEEDPYYVWPNG